ncbi:MAG: Gfo/Idh/MocA family oxidoreductase [Nostoc sp.]|uniref:Gfo/Idh/MocA family protein n=1 Tax=Nostoc sp. TaxID=1180 RepID=UPI002FF1E341
MTKSLQVGIIGASVDSGWAKESHVPAVQKLARLELAAVATSRQSTADAAAKAFGAKAAYGNAADLIRDPDVDLVSVCIRVPNHRELVLGAIAAGKHVYCEWPLGRNITETEEMAAAAHTAGVHAAIGLQTRMNPVAHRARDLVASGAIGRLLSARLYSGTAAFSPKIAAADSYLENAENGATLVSIHGGHALDLAIAVLGRLEDVIALATTQYPEIQVGDEAARQARLIPDHLLVQARLTGGGALSIEVAGGRPPEATQFRLEVVGDKGNLALDGGAPRGFPTGRLRLALNGEPQHVDDGETGAMPDTAANVAGIYAALRDDIALGTSTAPDFTHAVRLARLVDDVLSSAQTGTRKATADWPVQ